MDDQKSLLIFTGAGFSKALNPEFPLTNEIYDRIRDEITNLDYFKYYYEGDNQAEIRDVEVLAHVLNNHAQPIKQSLHILSKCIEYSHLKKRDVFNDGIKDTGHAMKCLLPIQRVCEANLKYIHEQVLTPLFTTEPQPDTTTKVKEIIAQLIKKKFRLNIFSTNYDRAIRPILKDKDYYLVDGEVRLDLLFNPNNPNGYCYIPLKGMLDWKLADDGITIYQMPKFESKIENAAVMPLQDTSGFEKLPHKRLYDKFKEELGKADYLLFIGYSFRDEAINEAIRAIDSSQIKGLAIIHKESGETTQEKAEKGVAFREKIKPDLFPDYPGKPFISFGLDLDVDMMDRITKKLFESEKRFLKNTVTNASAISIAIKTTLSAVQDNNQAVFKQIIEGNAKQLTDLPSSTINLINTESAIATTAENIKHYKFLINCYMQDDGMETVRANANKLQDMITEALGKSKDLGNSDWIVMPAQMTEITKEMLGRRECLKISINLVVKAIELVS